MIAGLTMWILLVFTEDGRIELKGADRSEQACLRTLATAPEGTVAFCVPTKIPNQKQG